MSEVAKALPVLLKETLPGASNLRSISVKPEEGVISRSADAQLVQLDVCLTVRRASSGHCRKPELSAQPN